MPSSISQRNQYDTLFGVGVAVRRVFTGERINWLPLDCLVKSKIDICGARSLNHGGSHFI
jgi:hypothetical protein